VNDFFVRLDIFCRRERAQTMAEYVIVLGIITVTLMLALGALSGSVQGALAKVTRDL
jgi:Flp pilus assembly pilin Flp